MPIEINETIRVLSQAEFGDVSFEVMRHAFDIHKQLGRFCEEGTYQKELQYRLGERANLEVWIKVIHGDFLKPYRIDLLVDHGAIFELKARERIEDRHRNQLINYLMLTGLHHGKLVNFRPEKVQHEFVNSSISADQRQRFHVCANRWIDSISDGYDLRVFVEELLSDWGAGLDVLLYEDAVTHFFGGPEKVLRETDIVMDGRRLGRQTVRLINPLTMLKVTSLQRDHAAFEEHLLKLLKHTTLRYVAWINIRLHEVRFVLISK
jgi:GxxExxY protein